MSSLDLGLIRPWWWLWAQQMCNMTKQNGGGGTDFCDGFIVGDGKSKKVHATN